MSDENMKTRIIIIAVFTLLVEILLTTQHIPVISAQTACVPGLPAGTTYQTTDYSSPANGLTVDAVYTGFSGSGPALYTWEIQNGYIFPAGSTVVVYGYNVGAGYELNYLPRGGGSYITVDTVTPANGPFQMSYTFPSDTDAEEVVFFQNTPSGSSQVDGLDVQCPPPTPTITPTPTVTPTATPTPTVTPTPDPIVTTFEGMSNVTTYQWQTSTLTNTLAFEIDWDIPLVSSYALAVYEMVNQRQIFQTLFIVIVGASLLRWLYGYATKRRAADPENEISLSDLFDEDFSDVGAEFNRSRRRFRR